MDGIAITSKYRKQLFLHRCLQLVSLTVVSRAFHLEEHTDCYSERGTISGLGVVGTGRMRKAEQEEEGKGGLLPCTGVPSSLY